MGSGGVLDTTLRPWIFFVILFSAGHDFNCGMAALQRKLFFSSQNANFALAVRFDFFKSLLELTNSTVP